MVFLHQQNPSRKRSPSFIPPFPRPEILKSTSTTTQRPPQISQNDTVEDDQVPSSIDKMVLVLADAGCTLINPSGPPCLPSNHHKFRNQLNRLFSTSNSAPALRSSFLSGFSSYINSPQNLRRVLAFSKGDGFGAMRSESLVRQLLLVPTIQLDLQIMLLEKLPEYFDANPEDSRTTLSLEDDMARLIINQFRWLDFVVDTDAFLDKLMQVLSVCPLHLKKEIIGSLPEITGDQSNKAIVDSLEQMLEEDSGVIVPVLDAFSNYNLDEVLQEQVITTALSCMRTIDGEHMPYLVRFLLLLATPQTVRRIVSQIREQLKFVGISNSCHVSQQRKLKRKSFVDNTEASILDALRSSLLFKNMLCQEVLKELNSIHKPQDHKVIDIWLLVLIYMNSESMQKSVVKILKKKIVENCIPEVMIDQCICGNKELVQDYFPSFLSLSEHLLASKEQKARNFGIHMYTCLFGEFDDTYCRQEVLGALVTHVGSGVNFEVNSSLETIAHLVSKYPQELIPISAHLNGILDYLEGFGTENLHKVYEVLIQLALSARSITDCFGYSVANELLMIIQKQVSHPDIEYKKMGLIGTLKVVSCLGDINNGTRSSSSQKSNCEEALELLRNSLDSCMQLFLPSVLFYDELTTILHQKKLQPAIVEWIGKHAGGFESKFLSDLQGGRLPGKELYCNLEGELWMNLDGDISPICLSILPLASSSFQFASPLQLLPANFLLLAAVERVTNQGSLGGIDALVGCPLHLPSSMYFSEAGWQVLTAKQKQIICLSLYYAANWIRELLNAFCTQVAGSFECTSQAMKEDTNAKLLKRLRNLVLLESLLNNCIKCYPLSLPELHLQIEHSGTSLLNKANNMVHLGKNNGNKKTQGDTSLKKRRHKKTFKKPATLDMNGKLQQPTIMDVLQRAGATIRQEVLTEDSSSQSSKGQTFLAADRDSSNTTGLTSFEVSAFDKVLESQRFKFRPLLIQCFSLLTFSNNQNSCCHDPAAELPLYLYLLRDLHYKLDYFMPPERQVLSRGMSTPAGYTRMTCDEFLSNVRPIFPNLRRHFENAVFVLQEGDGTCEDHWKIHSASAGNPDVARAVFSKSQVSTLVFKEVLHCFSKILSLADVQMNKQVLSDLLEAFQPSKTSNSVFPGLQHSLSPGTTEYLYLGASSFLEDAFDMSCSFSFMLASDALLALESVVTSVQALLDKLETTSKDVHSPLIHRILTNLCSRLGTSAQKLLRHNWNTENLENSRKKKGEMVQKILLIYLKNSESRSDLLDELACFILPEAASSGITAEDEDHGFPMLCNSTFVVWYRVLHEVNLAILNKLVKKVALFVKPRPGIQLESVEKHLIEIQKSVNVLVSLVNICRTHEKVTMHAMAVKYGGQFVDSFLKVFDFLQAYFHTHNDSIIQLVKELQMATRTIQTICSEAKGSKRTAITSKIPATKRSLERFLFRVKALLHSTSSGCTFWMGNLKHKDLMGQVVSSQAYVDDQNNIVDEDLADAIDEDQPLSVASGDRDTE